VAQTFTPADVRRLAALARLELSDEEITLFAGQLSGILAFAAEVESVNTDGVVVGDPSVPGAPLRDDEVTPSLPREQVLSASADADVANGLFTVPRVFTE
jgi:aspartyl-tRNA(Asn)/glutamyl-tRNA(Gln) amidotransferase subunit C